jgi:hypothetical protein
MLGVRREGVTEAAGKLQHMLAARERETRRAIAGAASSAQETAMATGRAERAEQELTDLQAKHTDRVVVVTLGDVLFATGSSELQEGSQRSIRVLVHRGIFWSRRGPCFLGARSYPSAITHSAFLDQPRRRRPRPNENCPLRMRWASWMPAIVMAAFANDLNPAIDAQRRLIAR